MHFLLLISIGPCPYQKIEMTTWVAAIFFWPQTLGGFLASDFVPQGEEEKKEGEWGPWGPGCGVPCCSTRDKMLWYGHIPRHIRATVPAVDSELTMFGDFFWAAHWGNTLKFIEKQQQHCILIVAGRWDLAVYVGLILLLALSADTFTTFTTLILHWYYIDPTIQLEHIQSNIDTAVCYESVLLFAL